MQTYSRPPRLQPAAACGALLHRPGRLGRHRLPQRLRRGLRLPRRDRYARRLCCDACRVAAPRQEELDDDLGALCAAARLGPGLVRGLWQAHRGVPRAAGDAALGLLPAGRAPWQGQQRQRSERRRQQRRRCGGGPGEQGSCAGQEEAMSAFRHRKNILTRQFSLGFQPSVPLTRLNLSPLALARPQARLYRSVTVVALPVQAV